MDIGAVGRHDRAARTLRTDDQIAEYFAQAVEAIGHDMPWVVQDYPQASAVVMAPAVIRRIVKAHPSCVMLKAEEWPGLEKITRGARFMQEGQLRPISILTGNGGVFVDFEMERGADGAMTGLCVPRHADGRGRLSGRQARRGARPIRPASAADALRGAAGLGLAVRKYVLKKRGIIARHTAQAGSAADARDDRGYRIPDGAHRAAWAGTQKRGIAA